MARRRLTPTAALVEDVPRAEHPPPCPASRPARRSPGSPPRPPARRRSTEMAETLRRARDEGRMVLELPLDAIAPDHLARDRLPAEDAEAVALRESLRLHGQRMPIEVTPLAGALPYGLISGWRRLEALKALHAETGEARFATVQALVRRPETAADAYVAMVEENEIRVGLSQYERARVAARATERGVFESEKAALLALFATASRPKRSRIRAFLEIYHALDGSLRFPAQLPERLGLALVERIRAGGGRAHGGGARRGRPADAGGRAGDSRPRGAGAAAGARGGGQRGRAPARAAARASAARAHADAAAERGGGRARSSATRSGRCWRGGSPGTSGWRRERDSNPRDGSPPTHFPGVRHRPLGHLSGGRTKPSPGRLRKPAAGPARPSRMVRDPTNRRKFAHRGIGASATATDGLHPDQSKQSEPRVQASRASGTVARDRT